MSLPDRDPSWAYRRAIWRDADRHQRALYAWRDSDGWQCQLSGHGMRPRLWWSPTQSGALQVARLAPALISGTYTLWTPKGHLYALWDGFPDEYRPSRPLAAGETGWLFGVGPELGKSISNTGLLCHFDPCPSDDIDLFSRPDNDLGLSQGGVAFVSPRQGVSA